MKITKNISPTQLVTLSNLATAGFGFVTFFILVRGLSLATFGEWVLYITAFNLAEMVRTGLVRQGMVHLAASAKNEETQKHIRSAAFYLSLLLSVVAGLGLLVIYFLFYKGHHGGIALFFMCYPLVSIVSLVPQFDIWVSQAAHRMGRMAALNLLPAASLALIALASLWWPLSLWQLVLLHGAIRLLATVFSLLGNKEVTTAILSPHVEQMSALWQFGRFSVATLLGTNLLKSADNFLIAAFIGAEAVAIYNVPLKLLEIAEIPVRSTAQVIFPKISALFGMRKYHAVALLLQQQIGRLLRWYVPAALLALFAAKYLVVAAGGNNMAQAHHVLRVFLVYVMLLPIDRLLGVAIDSTGKPKFNAIKVWLMVLLNVLGDVLVLWWLQSLVAVAAVTVLNALAGVLVGYLLLKLQLSRLGYQVKFKRNNHVAIA
ncbi:oligosaccharide flippase family protein [bacterium]|nr:oligosaccharide flippase family protein [bacterium]